MVQESSDEFEIAACVERLSSIVQVENSALQLGSLDEIDACLNVKNECLVELFRIMKRDPVAEVSETVRARIVELRDLLETNASRLKIHCDAIEQILAIVRPKESTIRDFIY